MNQIKNITSGGRNVTPNWNSNKGNMLRPIGSDDDDGFSDVRSGVKTAMSNNDP